MAEGGYDGSLKFDTGINTEGFERDSLTLKQAAKTLGNVISEIGKSTSSAFGDTSSVIGYKNKIEATRRQIELLEEELKNLESAPAEAKEADMERYRQKIADAELAMEQLLNKREVLEQQLMPSDLPGHSPEAVQAIYENNKEWQKLTQKIDAAALSLEKYDAEQRKIAESDIGDYQTTKYQKIANRIAQLNGNLDQYKVRLSEIIAKENKSSTSAERAEKSHNRLSKSMGKTRREAIPLTKSILKLSNMFKLMIIRMSMRAMIQSSRDGFQNIAQYSDTANTAISSLMSSLTMLKNSFAAAFTPVAEYASPAMTQFLTIVLETNNHLAQLMAALTGKDSYVKAVAVQEDYAESLGKTNSALKDEEKALKKTSYAFDNLIQRQTEATVSNLTPGKADPSEMFETVKVENDMKDLAEAARGIFSDMFSPLRESWAKNGPVTITEAKNAFHSLKALASDVGKSFLQVWNDEGYGQKISSDLIVTFGNMAQTVANLSARFDTAWTTAGLGTSIIRHLGDIVLEITGFFREASGEIRNWSATLDFTPLLKSLDKVLTSVSPLINRTGKLILWLLKDVLLPLASWTITDALPVFFDLLAAAVDLAVAAIDALTPLATWLWEEFLKPLGQWTGKLFIDAIKKIIEYLVKFTDWINENQGAVEDITLAVLAFFMAWKFMEFVSGIAKMLSMFPTLISQLGQLDIKFLAIVAVITTIIYIAAKVAQAWDKMTPSEKLATAIIAIAGAIALVVAAVAIGFKDLSTFLIAGSIAAIAGISILGIASNANSRKSNYSASPYTSSPYSIEPAAFRMPRLATGTVVPARAGEFAAILGDNNREAEVVSPLSTIEQALENVLARRGEENNRRPIEIVMEVDRHRFARLVYEMGNEEKQRVGVRMVTEG